MQTISKEQLYNRLDIMPQNLRDIFFSQDASEQVHDICQNEHLSDEKSGVVSQLVGDILLGFVHREDLPKEIQRELGIDIKICESIYDHINRKLFFSIANEIDQFYSPVSKNVEQVARTVVDEDVIELKPIVENKEIETPKLVVEEPKVDFTSPFTVNQEPVRVSSTSVKLENNFENQVEPSAGVIKSNISQPPKPETEIETPHILHKVEDTNVVKSQKASLGGFFGILKKNPAPSSSRSIHDSSIMANVIVSGNKPQVKSTKQDMPPIKIVNYSLSQPIIKDNSQLNPFGFVSSDTPKASQAPSNDSVSVKNNAVRDEAAIKPRVIDFNTIQKNLNSGNTMPEEQAKMFSASQDFKMDQSAISSAPFAPQNAEMDVPAPPSPPEFTPTPLQNNPIPTPAEPTDVALKDIPIEDVVDLRKI